MFGFASWMLHFWRFPQYTDTDFEYFERNSPGWFNEYGDFFEAHNQLADPREGVRDPTAGYWGGQVEEHSLVPLGDARLGRIGLDEWIRRSRAAA